MRDARTDEAESPEVAIITPFLHIYSFFVYKTKLLRYVARRETNRREEMKNARFYSLLTALSILGSGAYSNAQADVASDYVSCIKGLQAMAPSVPNNGWANFEGSDTFGFQCYQEDDAMGSTQYSFVLLSEAAGFRKVVYPIVQYVGNYSWGRETVKLPRNIIEMRSNGKKYFLGNFMGVFDLVTEAEFNKYITVHTEFGHSPAKAKQVLIDRYVTELKGRSFPALETVAVETARSCLLTKINVIASSVAMTQGVRVIGPADQAAMATRLVPACRTVYEN
jgi:hypothetical protein